MRYMTEEEASKCWCPLTLGAPVESVKCLGSACMFWDYGQKTTQGEQQVVEETGWLWWKRKKVLYHSVYVDDHTVGFCSLRDSGCPPETGEKAAARRWGDDFQVKP